MECPQPNCHRRFSNKYNLQRHQRVNHEHYRPHLCQYCFKAFASKQNKTVHEYQHQRVAIDPIPVDAIRRGEGVTVEIVPLTELVKRSKDPDLRPYAKVMRIYCWPVTQTNVSIPEISAGQQWQTEVKLPSLLETLPRA